MKKIIALMMLMSVVFLASCFHNKGETSQAEVVNPSDISADDEVIDGWSVQIDGNVGGAETTTE